MARGTAGFCTCLPFTGVVRHIRLTTEPALKPKIPTQADRKARVKRAALNALRRARRAAERAGVELSEWEGEFLGSVESRVEKYGRAFADPDLGAEGGALSLRQGMKLKEISAKARRGDKKDADRPDKTVHKPGPKRRAGLGRSTKSKPTKPKPR